MSTDGMTRLLKKFGFPLVVKGVYYGAYVAYTEADAVASFRYYEATWGLPVIVQQHLAGDEYNVCALGDGTGATIGAVAMRKLALTDKGKGWSGVTVGSPELLALAARVVEALKWRGPLEVEVIAEGGALTEEALHVIEVNPRFPAWCYLTAASGQNLPAACARLAMGQPVTALPPYQTGRMFVRISLDQVADMATFGQLSSIGLLPSTSGTRT
jgi:carbamoyl-phosphate synthase large subunit